MLSEILSDIAIFLSASLKFILSVIVVITGNMGIDGSISSVLGGLSGVVMFTFFGDFLKNILVEKYPKRFGSKFNKYARMLVKIRRSIGLKGLALITPITLSIPVGVILALILTSNKRKILTYMSISTLFWSAIFFLPYHIFKIDIISWVRSFF